MNRFIQFRIQFFLVALASLCSLTSLAYADLVLNILAINSTEQEREKELVHFLPQELTQEDILDTDALELDYDVNREAYFVKGNVRLGPKETKTLRVRIRDIWAVNEEQIDGIKEQIAESVARIEGTEYAEIGQIKRASLTQRLDMIVEQQAQYSDNAEKRIDHYRIYSHELEKIRRDAVSPKYWRSQEPVEEGQSIFNYIIELENPSTEVAMTVEPKHYLPSEVKPEHILDLQGFDIRYDIERGQTYLTREETLEPGEKKSYSIGIVDIWNINQTNISNLKKRTSTVYKLLETTQYANSAGYLVSNIKKNLESVEASQAVQKEIKAHVSAYRTNTRRFDSAEKDVEALEDLLEAVREDLERSILKNVLQKLKALTGIADIAKALFNKKLTLNQTLKIIIWIVGFVGLVTGVHFVFWARKSRVDKIKEREKEEQEEEK